MTWDDASPNGAPPGALRLPALIAYTAAVFIIAASFTSYAGQFSPVGRWQADTYDPADYRFVAEYFWNVPFVPDTYASYVSDGWDSFLKTVPFRGIGLGTMYLIAGCFESATPRPRHRK